MPIKSRFVFAIFLFCILFGNNLRSDDFDPFKFNKPIEINQNQIIAIPRSNNILFGILSGLWSNHLTKIDGPRCPMYPTCSHFFRIAVKKRGLYFGFITTLTRMLKETPDMLKYGEYKLVLKYGRYRFFDPIENYNLTEKK